MNKYNNFLCYVKNVKLERLFRVKTTKTKNPGQLFFKLIFFTGIFILFTFTIIYFYFYLFFILSQT